MIIWRESILAFTVEGFVCCVCGRLYVVFVICYSFIGDLQRVPITKGFVRGLLHLTRAFLLQRLMKGFHEAFMKEFVKQYVFFTEPV